MTHVQVRLLASRRARRPWALPLLLVGCALLRPAVVTAEPATSAPSPQAQYRQAHDAMNAKRWDEARRLLLELWTHAQTYDVASDLMFVEYHLGNFASAANYGQFASRNVPPVADADDTARLQKGLEQVKKRVGAISINVDRPGAEVHVDSVVVGTSPLASEIYVDVGPHRVRAELEGAASPELRVDALAGETYKVELALPRPAAANSEPQASSHLQPSAVTPDSPRQKPSYAPAIVAASVGGVALVGGISFLIVSANKQNAADDRANQLGGDNPCAAGITGDRIAECQKISNLAESSTTFRTLAFVGFGVAAGAGIASFVLWPRSHSGVADKRFVPTVSFLQRGAFAAVRGAF